MCLIKPKKVEVKEPMMCYKVLLIIQNGRKKRKLISPYKSSEYRIGKMKRARGKKDVDRSYYIEGGFLHSFKYLDDAVLYSYRRFTGIGCDVKIVIVACEIPKGTKTYEGSFEFYPSIACTKMLPMYAVPLEDIRKTLEKYFSDIYYCPPKDFVPQHYTDLKEDGKGGDTCA